MAAGTFWTFRPCYLNRIKIIIAMKKSFLTSLLLVLPLFLSSQAIDKKEVLDHMILANGYFMTKWPDVGKTIITNKERPSNIWTRGVYYEGLMALYQIWPKEDTQAYSQAKGRDQGEKTQNLKSNRR